MTNDELYETTLLSLERHLKADRAHCQRLAAAAQAGMDEIR